MRKRLESPNISRSSVGNRHLSSGNDSRIQKQFLNPLFRIYQIDRYRIWCKSCRIDVQDKDAQNHLYDDQHIHLLQREFLRNKIKSASNHQIRGIGIEIKKKSHSQQSTQRQIEKTNLNKSREITLVQSTKSLKQFVNKLIEDLNLIGYCNLSLIVAFLSETQCNIKVYNELTFQHIIDRRNYFVINSYKESSQWYPVNKLRVPEFLRQYIQKNLGSNKSLLDSKLKNKCLYLRQQLKKCCLRIAKITKDKDYQEFLTNFQLKSIKGLALQQQDDRKNELVIDDIAKYQNYQQNGKEQRENIQQRLGDQRKSNIRIVIKTQEQN